MRTPASLGDLLPIAVPGFLVMGALSVLVTPTIVGALAFGGPWTGLVLGVLTGTLVLGYILAGAQEALSARVAAWALPPQSHFAGEEAEIDVPARALQRAGYAATSDVRVPLGAAFALERSLSGSWGTPEGAGWDRVAFLQRVTLAFLVSAVLALAFLVIAGATGNLGGGIRSHAGAVLILGGLGSFLVARAVTHARREAVLELLADARALLLDRGEQAEVRRVLGEVGLELVEESAVSVPR